MEEGGAEKCKAEDREESGYATLSPHQCIGTNIPQGKKSM